MFSSFQKNSAIFAISAVATVFAICPLSLAQDSPPGERAALIAGINALVGQRNYFFSNYSKHQSLLDRYENNDAVLTIRNASNAVIRIDTCPLFYTIENIERDIAIAEGDTPGQKAEKIFTFIKERYKHAYPIHESREPHNSPRFFSVYGCGFCDDAAANMVYLSKRYDFDARVWELNGHVTSDVYYDNSWHVYDVDGIGIMYHDNEVADMNEVAALANEGTFKEFALQYKTMEDNKVQDPQPFITMEPDNPYLEFLPGETKRFYDKLFMISIDAGCFHNVTQTGPDTLDRLYGDRLTNFVREIPLNGDTVTDGKITVRDYFPFAGAFIAISGNDHEAVLDEKPTVFLDSRAVTIPVWLPALPYERTDSDNRYLNVTMGIRNLELYPSYEIRIGNLEELISTCKDPKLLTVHYYCYPNAQFDDASLAQLIHPGIVISK